MKKQKETIRRLKLLPGLFRKQDVEKLTPHTGMFLSRAIKKGLIHRLNRGNYVNSFLYGFPRIEEVACFLRHSAYVSCEWALNFHRVTLQSPTVCTVVTLDSSVGKKRNISYQGVTIEFSKISKSLFYGFTYQDKMYIASPEKAILDTLYYRGSIPAGDELELDSVDFDILLGFLEKYPKIVSRSFFNMVPEQDKT